MKTDLKKLKQQIERLFADNPRKLFNYKQIAAKLELDGSEDRNEIILAIKNLEKEQVIEELQPGKYASRFVHEFIFGKVDMTQRGAAYVVPENDTSTDHENDIFIQKENMHTALDGDKVKLQLTKVKNSGKRAGEIIEVLERYKTDFAGVVQLNFNYAFVVPDDRKMYADIFIPIEKINKAKNGEKVIARITEWNAHDENPRGEIIEILGKPGEHNAEMNAIVAEFGFANKFPEEVEIEAKMFSDKISSEEIAKRKDFRKTLTFTIDPADAKDFDDAISFKEIEKGMYEIGVHIADVSHYVTPKSKLNEEALKRGTSVYLVDRTIPMLPEVLSNNLCSLRPKEEKLTFSAVFKINEKAEVLDEWFGKTVIYSDRRFSYEEAQERIESGKGDLADEIIKLNELSKILRSERFENGAISFETQEVKFKLDENYKPVDIYIKVRKDAHKLIEEFMLMANKKVAAYVHSLKQGKEKKTYVYRVHENPNEDKLKMFSMFAARFGYKVKVDSIKQVAKSLNNFLIEVEGKPEQNVLQSQAIRTMAKAFYTCKKTGHYGLGFDFYTHFTSPIRRYPDLIAHRLLFDYLHNAKSADENYYEEICKQSSAMEQKAADAERASTKYKQVEYIRDFIGEKFEGIISGVTDWGMYIEITKYKCEGMIRLANLTDDYYEYDVRNQWILGRKTRKRYQLGDTIEVIVAGADIFKRQIDLEPADNFLRKQINKGSNNSLDRKINRQSNKTFRNTSKKNNKRRR